MKRFVYKATFLCLMLLFPLSLVGDTGAKVSSWFDNMNYSNVTNPGVYEGQMSRFATLGGISTRAPISEPFKFVTVQTPKFSAGCGGIDFYAGGFSAVNSDQFVENLRAIGQNAQSLAFMLAIQIVSPQLNGAMEYIQGKADLFNKMGMDSCEAASEIAGGALKIFDKEKADCTQRRMNAYGEDFSTASFGCSTGGKRKSTVDTDGDKNGGSFVRGNLAWYVMMQDPYFKGDMVFSELVLNIVGTLIMTDAAGGSDSPVLLRRITPAIEEGNEKERFDNIYAALLHGRDADSKLLIYRCDAPFTDNQDSCVAMSKDLKTITPNWDGINSKVKSMVESIARKAKDDSRALSIEEQSLVASTRIPLYRFITASTVMFPDDTNFDMISPEFSLLIANDILLRGLEGVIQKLEEGSSNVKKGISESKDVEAFRADLESVMNGLAEKKRLNSSEAELLLKMQEQIYQYERALLPKLGTELVSAAMWGNKQ